MMMWLQKGYWELIRQGVHLSRWNARTRTHTYTDTHTHTDTDTHTQTHADTHSSLMFRQLGESAAGALHPASCHNIIRDLGKLDGVQRGAASTIKGLGGIKGLIYEER